MRDVIADVCAFLRMPDDEFDVTHAKATRIAHLTAVVIENQYLDGTRIRRLVQWDSVRHPIPGAKVLNDVVSNDSKSG